MSGVQAGVLRLPITSIILVYLPFSYIVCFSVTPKGQLMNRRTNGELPLLPLGAAAAKRYIPLDCLLCPKLRLTNRTLVSIWLIYYSEYADEVVSPTETRPYSWR